MGQPLKILIIEKTVAHHGVASEPLAGTGVLECSRKSLLHRELLDQQVRHCNCILQVVVTDRLFQVEVIDTLHVLV